MTAFFFYFCVALIAALVIRNPGPRGGLPALLGPLLFVLVLALVGTFSRHTFAAWMEEDAWIEWATLIAFFWAAITFARRAASGRRTTSEALLTTAVFFGLALFCLLVAGEEISWGQRLLGLQAPEAFLAENYQQEINVHNLLTRRKVAGVKLDTKTLVAAIAAIYGFSALVAIRFSRPAWVQTLRPTAPPLALAPLLLIVAALELHYPFKKTGELAELLLGLAFLLSAQHATAASLTPAPPSTGSPPSVLPLKTVIASLVGTMVGGIFLTISSGAILSRLGQKHVATAQAELELLAADLQDPALLQGTRDRFKSSHKRLFTAVQKGRLAFPAQSKFLEGQLSAAADPVHGRRDRRGYFIDPWGNPYWMRYDRRHEVLYLYSFGANRRRDSDLKRELKRELKRDPKRENENENRNQDATRGDDLIVTVRFQTSSSGSAPRLGPRPEASRPEASRPDATRQSP